MKIFHRLEFGYFPQPLNLSSGAIRILTLPDLETTVADLKSSQEVEKDWIYAGPQLVHHLGVGVLQRPYSARVFGLPKTHAIVHSAAEGQDHLHFHLWALSFFTGTRLSSTDAGFVDATPIKRGKLVDFGIQDQGLLEALARADNFWIRHRSSPERARLFKAAVHALFLSQNPQLFQFEEFILLYTAIDACFALAKSIKSPTKKPSSHADRIKWMCCLFEMPIPPWADPALGTEVAILRNATMHEALFMGEPLGFAVHGTGTKVNITHEMRGLICRLIVALLGGENSEYVRTSVNTRQRQLLSFITP